jgi:TetR/AcrR family transcriptional repressor of nem operon
MRDAILDAAEIRARAGGYHGFSFREIAADVGIKSASVHYHFPTKADLAHAMVERYRLRAIAMLGMPDDAVTALTRLVELFRKAAVSNEMCLCGAIGASSGTLPPEVQASAAQFTVALAEWLRQAPDWSERLPMAPETILALLEGALLVSVTAGGPRFFEQAIAPLAEFCSEAV